MKVLTYAGLTRLVTKIDAAKADVSHTQASNTISAMTGYTKPASTSAIEATDSLNTAIGKLETALDNIQLTAEVEALTDAEITAIFNGTNE
jgi:hypothetical protein